MRSWAEEAAAKSGRGFSVFWGVTVLHLQQCWVLPHNPINSGAPGPESPRKKRGLCALFALWAFARCPTLLGSPSTEAKKVEGQRSVVGFEKDSDCLVGGHLLTRLLSAMASCPLRPILPKCLAESSYNSGLHSFKPLPAALRIKLRSPRAISRLQPSALTAPPPPL